MRMSEEGMARLIVIPIVAMLAVTMGVTGYQQREENNMSPDQQIDALEGTALSEDNEDKSESYTSRDPIRIDGNEDFAEKAEENGWLGDGSEDDPYVIEGYEIDGGGYESGYRARADGRYEYGIYIGNVTEHFVIRECYVHNITAISEYLGLDRDHALTRTPPGIFLFNSQNGRIEKNKINSSIALSGSSHNVIANNIIRPANSSSLDGHGITIIPSSWDPLKNSGHNDILNNTIYNKTIGITNTVFDRHGKYSPADINIENNTFVNVEEEYELIGVTEDDSSDNDSWFQAKYFYYLIALLGISMIIVGIGWKRVKGSGKK